MLYTYLAVFCKEDDGYTVLFPDFENATCGDSFDEAMYMAMELLSLNIYWSKEDNKELPVVSKQFDLAKIADEFSMSVCDLFMIPVTCNSEEYIQSCEEDGAHCIVKVKQELYDYANEHNMDLSQLLNDCISSKI